MRRDIAGMLLLLLMPAFLIIIMAWVQDAPFKDYQEQRFDLLLTDIVMPGMDGIELAKRAAELNATLKIMFITGFAAVALHPSSQAPKQAKVLSKPFHLREIVQEVERMIAA